METALDRFLAERITHHATHYTHQSVYAKKKYNIQDDDRETFWSLYNDHIANDAFISLCERPRPSGYTTIRGDIDIKIPDTVAASFLAGTHLYQPNEIMLLVEMYMDILRTHVKNVTTQQLICCVLEKTN